MKPTLLKKTEKLIKEGIKLKIPASVAPMLCTLTKEVIQDDKYLYELKWDGYRIISYQEKGKVKMDSRSSLNYTHKYPVVAKALAALKYDVNKILRYSDSFDNGLALYKQVIKRNMEGVVAKMKDNPYIR